MVVAICFLALFGRLNITALLFLTVCSQFIMAGSGYWYLHRSGWLPLRADLRLLGGLLKAGLKTHIATIATLLYVQFDQIWVRAVSGEEQTGLYNAAVTIAMQLMLLPMTIQEVLCPHIMQADPEDEAATIITVTRFAFFAFLGCLVIVCVLAWPLVMLLAGEQYEESVSLLRWLLPGILCFSIPNLLSPYWVKKGRFVLASATGASLLAVNFLLNYLWIPDHGALGAAWATDVTYLTGMLLSLVVFYLLSGHNPLGIFWITKGDVALVYEKLIGGLLATHLATGLRQFAYYLILTITNLMKLGRCGTTIMSRKSKKKRQKSTTPAQFPVGTSDQDDRIRAALGLSRDDPLPAVNPTHLRKYHEYLVQQLVFSFRARHPDELAAFLEQPRWAPRNRLEVTALVDFDECDLEEGLLCRALDNDDEEIVLPLIEIETSLKGLNRQLIMDYTHWFYNWPADEIEYRLETHQAEQEGGAEEPASWRTLFGHLIKVTLIGAFYGAVLGSALAVLDGAGIAFRIGAIILAIVGTLIGLLFGPVFGSVNRIQSASWFWALFGLVLGAVVGGMLGIMLVAFIGAGIGALSGGLLGRLLGPATGRRPWTLLGVFGGSMLGVGIQAWLHVSEQAASGAWIGGAGWSRHGICAVRRGGYFRSRDRVLLRSKTCAIDGDLKIAGQKYTFHLDEKTPAW